MQFASGNRASVEAPFTAQLNPNQTRLSQPPPQQQTGQSGHVLHSSQQQQQQQQQHYQPTRPLSQQGSVPFTAASYSATERQNPSYSGVSGKPAAVYNVVETNARYDRPEQLVSQSAGGNFYFHGAIAHVPTTYRQEIVTPTTQVNKPAQQTQRKSLQQAPINPPPTNPPPMRVVPQPPKKTFVSVETQYDPPLPEPEVKPQPQIQNVMIQSSENVILNVPDSDTDSSDTSDDVGDELCATQSAQVKMVSSEEGLQQHQNYYLLFIWRTLLDQSYASEAADYILELACGSQKFTSYMVFNSMSPIVWNLPFKFQKTASEFTLAIKRIAHTRADGKEPKQTDKVEKVTVGQKKLPFTQLGELSSQLTSSSGAPVCRIMFSLNNTSHP